MSELGKQATAEIVVVGPITRDTVAAVDVLPLVGGSALTSELICASGGKGANPAIAATRLGARVRLLGAVGADPVGVEVLDQLQRFGIAISDIARLDGQRTGEIIHLVERDGQRRFLECRGANGCWRLRIGVLAGRCRPGSSVLISTALAVDTVRRAAEEARAAGARVCLDLAGPAATSRTVIADADVIRADAHEAGELTGVQVNDFDSARHAAERLRRLGPSVAIVQAGDAGDLFLGDDLDLELPQLPAPTVDPTGAGDALIATWVTLTAAGDSPAHAARLASAAAGHTAAHLGGRPTFENLHELMSLIEERAE